MSFTLDAVNLAKRIGCQMFVGAGSQAEYGLSDHTVSPVESVHPESAYGVAKYSAGRQSAIFCSQIEMGHVWGRIFSTYGYYDNRNTMLMYAISSLLKSEKPSFTKCEQLWDYIFCEDAAYAFYLMGEKERTKRYIMLGAVKYIL